MEEIRCLRGWRMLLRTPVTCWYTNTHWSFAPLCLYPRVVDSKTPGSQACAQKPGHLSQLQSCSWQDLSNTLHRPNFWLFVTLHHPLFFLFAVLVRASACEIYVRLYTSLCGSCASSDFFAGVLRIFLCACSTCTNISSALTSPDQQSALCP